MIRVHIVARALNDISKVTLDNCDSLAYYNVSKLLAKKYWNDFTIIEAYFTATRVNDNDFKEMKELIDIYKAYHKQVYYQRCVVDAYGVGDNNQNFNKLYDNATIFHTKVYNKIKSEVAINNIKYLKSEKLQIEYKFKEALLVLDTIEVLSSKYEKVQHSYMRGICFMGLNEVEEAKQEFEFVQAEGGSLRLGAIAKVYLENIQNGIL